MKQYIIKRILSAIPLLIIISFVCFVFINLIPSDPAEVALRIRQVPIITEEAVAQVRAELGLDKPYLIRYISWLADCLRGDFGISYVNPSRTVAGELMRCLPATLQLAVITTFDIRMTRPNYEPVMNTAEVHTIEHLAATWLRNNDEWKDRVLYFGPMGCRTGFYLLLAGDLTSEEIVPLMKGLFTFMRDYKDEVPGACAKDCGNYLDMNLPMANWLADRFLREVLDGIGPERLVYPE